MGKVENKIQNIMSGKPFENAAIVRQPSGYQPRRQLVSAIPEGVREHYQSQQTSNYVNFPNLDFSEIKNCSYTKLDVLNP